MQKTQKGSNEMILICGSSLEGDSIIRSKIFTAIKLKYDPQRNVLYTNVIIRTSALVKSFAFKLFEKKKKSRQNDLLEEGRKPNFQRGCTILSFQKFVTPNLKKQFLQEREGRMNAHSRFSLYCCSFVYFWRKMSKIFE